MGINSALRISDLLQLRIGHFLDDQRRCKRRFWSIDEAPGSGLEGYPADMHLKLLNAGLIRDPLVGMNILATSDFETTDIWYFRKFSCSPLEYSEAELIFYGLDCYAEIYLNSAQIGSSDNMLVEHAFDVSGRLPYAGGIKYNLSGQVRVHRHALSVVHGSEELAGIQVRDKGAILVCLTGYVICRVNDTRSGLNRYNWLLVLNIEREKKEDNQ